MRGRRRLAVGRGEQELAHGFWLADLQDPCIIGLDLLTRWGGPRGRGRGGHHPRDRDREAPVRAGGEERGQASPAVLTLPRQPGRHHRPLNTLAVLWGRQDDRPLRLGLGGDCGCKRPSRVPQRILGGFRPLLVGPSRPPGSFTVLLT